jgi:protein arginine N-methyltransferase 1
VTETYSVVGYGRMVADATRLDAYARALEAVVRPGSVVLDIGSGTGVFALLACRLGARRVYAVEPADAIRTARIVARDNGLDGRIEFIQDVSTRVTLPERADVIVSDLRGVLPAFQSIVATLADARERLLAPGGVLVPRADTLFAAPVEAAEAWDDVAGPGEVLGFDFTAARAAAVNEWTRWRIRPEQLLAPGAPWATLDYRAATGPDLRGGVEWVAGRAGTAHGLAVWFHADLADGASFDSGPGTTTVYQTAFFPWPHPVALAAGDRVRADLQARLVAGEYVWMWDSVVERAGERVLRFRQSTFLANPPSAQRLRRRADGFRAALGEDGRIDAWVLGRMDGGATLGEIARELRERFPARFATWEAALTRVGGLSEQYAE